MQDLKKYIEAAVEALSPAKAQQLAKSFLEPGARKEQVTKAAQDLVEWSQRNRDRLKAFIAREVKEQLREMGLATRSELDALKKRVRELERSAGMTASGRKRAPAAKATKSRSSKATGAKRAASKG